MGVVCTDPFSDAYADYRCDRELWTCENGLMLFLCCNVAYSEVFSDDDFRACLTYAIDRDKIAANHYRGFAQTTTLPCSPSSPYYSPALAAKYGYDPSRFIDALSKIKKPKDPIRLLVNKDDSLRLRAARDIADMLTECGLETVTVEQETNKYLNDIRIGKFDLFLGQTRLSPNMDLSAFFHTTGALSHGGVNDVAAYALALQALENHGNYYTLYQTIMDEGLLCPILTGSYAVYATRGLLTGLTPARDNIFYYSLGKTMGQAKITEQPTDSAQAS